MAYREETGQSSKERKWVPEFICEFSRHNTCSHVYAVIGAGVESLQGGMSSLLVGFCVLQLTMCRAQMVIRIYRAAHKCLISYWMGFRNYVQVFGVRKVKEISMGWSLCIASLFVLLWSHQFSFLEHLCATVNYFAFWLRILNLGTSTL